jgi:hypothetical protein
LRRTKEQPLQLLMTTQRSPQFEERERSSQFEKRGRRPAMMTTWQSQPAVEKVEREARNRGGACSFGKRGRRPAMMTTRQSQRTVEEVK